MQETKRLWRELYYGGTNFPESKQEWWSNMKGIQTVVIYKKGSLATSKAIDSLFQKYLTLVIK